MPSVPPLGSVELVPVALVPVALAARRRAHGADPLLTYYDLDSGERTELSTVTFANWVDKTANLLLDLDVGPGDPLSVDLLASHPGHWVSMVWVAAAWQVGAVLTDSVAPVRVVGPAGLACAQELDAQDVVACSLHPLGLGFSEPLPAGVIDYGVEVRGFPDQFAGVPLAGDVVGWDDGGETFLQRELLAAARPDVDARLLLRPTTPRATVTTALLRPLQGAGSSVVVVGQAGEDRLGSLATTERALVEK